MWIKLRQKTGKPHTPLLFLTSEINFLIKKKKYVDAPQLPIGASSYTFIYLASKARIWKNKTNNNFKVLTTSPFKIRHNINITKESVCPREQRDMITTWSQCHTLTWILLYSHLLTHLLSGFLYIVKATAILCQPMHFPAVIYNSERNVKT